MTTARQLADPQHGSGWQFQLAGFPVSVPWNALLGVGVIAVLWYPEFAAGTSRTAGWLIAAVFAALLMLSILIHELAHAYAARAFRYPVAGITLWAMGGFTTYRTTARHGPLREAVIALAGPVATLLIAYAAWVAAGVLPAGIPRDLLAALAWANFLVGFFNLLPGMPLDGGAVVKALVWAVTGSDITGQIVAAWVGRALAVLVVVSPFLLAWRADATPSLVLIVVAVVLAGLLWTGASGSLRSARAARTLGSVTAADLALAMDAVPAGLPVAAALPRLRPGAVLVIVDDAGRPRAVVSEAAARAVPESEQVRVTVAAVSAGIAADAPVVAPDTPATQVVEACQETGSRFVLVAGPGAPPAVIDTDSAFVTEGA